MNASLRAASSMMSEFLYVLSNPSFPGHLKVGYTVDVETRIAQLFTTGVPTPFVVEFVAAVADGREAERLAHQALRQHRVADNREFFAVEVEVALRSILASIGNHTVHVDRPGVIKQAAKAKLIEMSQGLEAQLAQLLKRTHDLARKIADIEVRLQQEEEKHRRAVDAYARAEKALKVLGGRPLRPELTLRERLAGKTKFYEDAYAEMIGPWVAAEALIESTRIAILGCEAELVRARADADTLAPGLRREWATAVKEVDGVKARIRSLREQL